jgi:flagellum-specific ATP synthase
VRDSVITAEHREAANALLQLEAAWRAHEDLISVGAYKSGADRRVDAALAIRDEWLALLRQRAEEWTPLADTVRQVRNLAAKVRGGAE